ncbi:Acyl-ACP thioesterase [Limihaloglobus sulfuriphilus]|uniref:Acyl-ACP thioesterase n=1 Tax=Limihaloglobus sulfuriphilus TaxID=1851148 RepID=A0A1Q2ME71_9BACT|nr:thioesterase family protein [Limihaloglobus sulfuriphilus]AQQ70838.1 Acyl-ACP thioesterase [Limihaloglobus sulfuriphilus]
MFKETIVPRLSETDGLKHINNTSLSIWFEHCRVPIFKFFVPGAIDDFESWNIILARSEYDFLSQIYFGKDVEVKTWVNKIGNSSFTVEQEAWQDGHRCAHGLAVGVHYDFKTQRSMPIPESVREKLQKHLREPHE